MVKTKTAALSLLRADLHKRASAKKARDLARFFKTGPGEYGEGDVFIGVVVPDTRQVAKAYSAISLRETIELLHSKIHEERLCAILILIEKFRQGDKQTQAKIYRLYLDNTKYINNWDLIDLSAHHIVGQFLTDKPKVILSALAESKSMWERRIAVLSTFHYIARGKADDALKIAAMLLQDDQDLIHKAVGWMLREVGKRCGVQILEDFLHDRYKKMPRTMLRYAIEKLPERRRISYLKGLV